VAEPDAIEPSASQEAEVTSSRPAYDHAATEENASGACDVPQLAEPSTLPTITRLPDPFTRIDGTRIATGSEWPCRRQEILEQAQRYVYGDKPMPDSVAGSVADDAIDVRVETATSPNGGSGSPRRCRIERRPRV
jgi:hypothetical protein